MPGHVRVSTVKTGNGVCTSELVVVTLHENQLNFYGAHEVAASTRAAQEPFQGHGDRGRFCSVEGPNEVCVFFGGPLPLTTAEID